MNSCRHLYLCTNPIIYAHEPCIYLCTSPGISYAPAYFGQNIVSFQFSLIFFYFSFFILLGGGFHTVIRVALQLPCQHHWMGYIYVYAFIAFTNNNFCCCCWCYTAMVIVTSLIVCVYLHRAWMGHGSHLCRHLIGWLFRRALLLMLIPAVHTIYSRFSISIQFQVLWTFVNLAIMQWTEFSTQLLCSQ